MRSIGILRKYWKTATMSATSYTGDSPLFLLDYLLRLIRVVVLLSLWRIILADKGVPAGYTVAIVLTYTLIAEVFAEQLDCTTELPAALWNGTIATRFLHPLGLFSQFMAETVGRWTFAFLTFSLPLLLLAPLLGVNTFPASVEAGLFFVLSLVLAVTVGFAIEFIFGAIMVTLEQNVWTSANMRHAISTLLSGALIPLALLPWGLGEVFTWLPFASMASAPLRIYTGTGDPLMLIGLQIFWSLLLWPVANWLWSRSRERLASYGG